MGCGKTKNKNTGVFLPSKSFREAETRGQPKKKKEKWYVRTPTEFTYAVLKMR